MLIFDNSGSMNSFAYANDPDASENEKQEKKGEEQEKSCSESFLENNPNLYGYFDPNASYTYNGDYWDKTDSADSGVSGNELNCLYMDRVDIARKVLTGGKLSGDTTPDGRPILVTQGGYHDGYYDEKGRVAASEKEVAGVAKRHASISGGTISKKASTISSINPNSRSVRDTTMRVTRGRSID